eukprot:TRINITY_DN25935_c0_g1_i1.p1 TRINITY_DN25935_c0_g1~~TRINITY_DN25935_c0_g1_i1.p1  ORF type:complete len:749 (+),score=109.00 TRINITY_DN25935_c0_g1_i1:92-2248(+)
MVKNDIPQGAFGPRANSSERPGRKNQKHLKTNGPICLADPPTLRPVKSRRDTSDQHRLVQQALQAIDSHHRHMTELLSNVLNSLDGPQANVVPAYEADNKRSETDFIGDPVQHRPGVVYPFGGHTNKKIVDPVFPAPFAPLYATRPPSIHEMDSCEVFIEGCDFKKRSVYAREGPAQPPCSSLPGVPLEAPEELTVETYRGCEQGSEPSKVRAGHCRAKEGTVLEKTESVSKPDAEILKEPTEPPPCLREVPETSRSDTPTLTRTGSLVERILSFASRKAPTMFVDEKEDHEKRMSKALRSRAIFNDKSEMLEQVLEALGSDEYNVQDYYKTSGWAQAIARSTFMEYLTLATIATNSLWIAVESDLNHEPVLVRSHFSFILVENLFCLFFVFEWSCRCLAFQRKRDGLRDSWFVFDFALAFCMAFETWGLSILMLTLGKGISNEDMKNTSVLKLFRLLRLTRTARMVRLLQWVPELMIMLKGLSAGFRSVATTLLLLLIIVYIFSIAFRQVTDGSVMGAKYFRTIPDGMLNLIVLGIIPDVQDLVMDLSEESIITGFLAFAFILIGSVTVLNLLVGVLVEAVAVVACVEKEESAARFVKSSLAGILHEVERWNGEEDHEVSLDEFLILVSRRDFAKVMVDVGVDIANLVGLSEWLFKDGRTMPVAEFYKLIMQLRGSNYATVKDIVDMRKYLTDVMEHIEGVVVATGNKQTAALKNAG